jgi:hypothetical protein
LRPQRRLQRPDGDLPGKVETGGRVLPEFVEKAKALRALIKRSTPAFEKAVEGTLRTLRPRPAWPEPGRGEWYKNFVARYRAIRSPCRLDFVARVEPDGALVMNELRVTATTIKREDWGDGDEGALSVQMVAVSTHPFRIQQSLIADIGLHALARRYQRGWTADDGSVLIDLAPLGIGWAKTVKAGGTFRVAAPLGQGEWIGVVSEVRDRDLPVLLVRTYVG